MGGVIVLWGVSRLDIIFGDGGGGSSQDLVVRTWQRWSGRRAWLYSGNCERESCHLVRRRRTGTCFVPGIVTALPYASMYQGTSLHIFARDTSKRP